MAHTTVAARHAYEEVIRGSRFLAVVAPVDTPEEAAALVEALRREHPDASHHCSAWRIDDGVAFDDDGEPGGTAGRPMSSVLLKRGLDHVVAVCVRWFGGTKLGAGGLVRAYAGTVAKALDEAGTTRVHDMTRVRIHVPFAFESALHHLLDEWPHVAKAAPEYAADGVRILAEVRAEEVSRLEAALADATAGAGRLEPATTAA